MNNPTATATLDVCLGTGNNDAEHTRSKKEKGE